MALAMGECPTTALKESDRAAWVLVIVGGLSRSPVRCCGAARPRWASGP
jgi:hypothetical protein